MNIAMASDQNYANYLNIAATSILETNKGKNLSFYIIDQGITVESKKRVEQKVLEHGQSITFISPTSLMGGVALEVDDSISAASYYRLFLTNIEGIDRVIYLDCDGAVNGDLQPLWKIELGDCMLAGVQDAVSTYYRKAVGLEKEEVYINAGVLLMDLKKMRQFHWNEKVIDFIRRYQGVVPHHDQGVINGLARGKILLVPPKYNALDIYFKFSPEEMKRKNHLSWIYNETEFEEARKKPIFIHFTAGWYGRVWDVKCIHPLKEIYYQMIDLAGYKRDEILTDRPENKNLILMRKLYEIFPLWMMNCLEKMIEVKKIIWRKETIQKMKEKKGLQE